MPRSHGQSATGYRPWKTETRKTYGVEGAKHSKPEAKYTPDGTMKEHCSICTHYVPPSGGHRWARCMEVSGEISAKGWCRFFSKA